MYKLDVSTWCYLKRRVENKKLNGVGLTLDNKDVDKFSDIVIRQNDESIHVNVNYTVSLFSDKFITYLDLFGIKSPYSLKNYFNSWVSYELNKPKYQSSKIKYLVVFCNDKLELSEDNKLTLCSSKNSYPFQFESMDICQIPVLQDMLVTNTSCKFYKFATDDQTIDEFCQRLMLSKLNLTNNNQIQNNKSEKYFPLKLKKINVTKKRYKIFKNWTNLNESMLFEFASEDLDTLLELLNPSNNIPLQNEQQQLTYTFDQYQEVTLRWIEYQKHQITTPRNEWKLSKCLSRLVPNLRNEIFYYLTNGKGKEIIQNFKDAGIDLRSLGNVMDSVNGNPTQNLQNLNNAGIKFTTISKLLQGSRTNSFQVLDEFFNLFFDKDGSKTKYLKTFDNHNINIDDISWILWGQPVKASTIFKDLYNLLFDAEGEKTKFLKTLENYGINIKHLAKMIRNSNIHAIKLLKDLFELWFDDNGNKSYYIKHFENVNIDLIRILKYLQNAHSGTVSFFKALYEFLIDENGTESFHLSTLNKYEISVDDFLRFLHGTAIDHVKYINPVFYTFFDKEGNKTQLLYTFENKGVDLELLSLLFTKSRNQGIKIFHDIFFDEKGQDSEILQILEKKNVCLFDVCNIFLLTSSKTPLYFKMLFELWFDEDFKETQYLQDLERNGITLNWMCQILRGAGIYACEAFKGTHKLFIDENGSASLTLQTVIKYMDLKKLQNIFPRGGMSFTSCFPKLFNCWFDEKGEKTHFLLTMKKNNFDIDLICDILKDRGGYASTLFISLYKLFFDPEGNPSSYISHFLNNPFIIKSVSKIIFKTRGTFDTFDKKLICFVVQ
uniref:Uncharacterized protein n=1 Tax=Trichogramma kaykai TaxID=54128 RepID=A0ABD2WLD8_9HYME